MQKKGSAASGAAREKIAGLQEHASKVENLLTSMQVSTEMLRLLCLHRR